jgi:hypothetical protein
VQRKPRRAGISPLTPGSRRPVLSLAQRIWRRIGDFERRFLK